MAQAQGTRIPAVRIRPHMHNKNLMDFMNISETRSSERVIKIPAIGHFLRSNAALNFPAVKREPFRIMPHNP